MSFTIDAKTAQGSQMVRCVQTLREAQNLIDDMANVAAGMTLEQMQTYTGFSGTLEQLQATLTNVQTVLNTNQDIQNLITLLIW